MPVGGGRARAHTSLVQAHSRIGGRRGEEGGAHTRQLRRARHEGARRAGALLGARRSACRCGAHRVGKDGSVGRTPNTW
jgi:hypothetical protein